MSQSLKMAKYCTILQYCNALDNIIDLYKDTL